MATRFVASNECEAHQNFKDQYLAANAEDVTIIESPVGLPGRAIRNDFTKAIAGKLRDKIRHCDGCLKHCSAKFCILDALKKSVAGDIHNGLVFSGEFVGRIKEILPVQEIMDRLAGQLEQALALASQKLEIAKGTL
jgi:NAD(P)H-dependent flavin oxidoreductase YrpB (nitropropane dioxygenase family)